MTSARTRRQRTALLEWYEPRRAAYPWRRTADPYAVLVSEVMLQQTQASRVAPSFERFLSSFPTVRALAAAPRADVIRSWNGLGYNRRAVALSISARRLVDEHDAAVPSDVDVLRSLPGIGPYTSAAVASIAFGVPVAAVDTNARRVARRVLDGRDDTDAVHANGLAEAWLDRGRPGDWNQAVMDLGRESCRARPDCGPCALRSVCSFAETGAPAASPGRRQSPFAGSARQVRGAVVRVLRSTDELSFEQLASASGHPTERVADALDALAADGIVETLSATSTDRRVRLAT